MDKKVLQEQRKRSYFLDAAKKLIKEEGVDSLTVKKVAALAGFAPGTLYNYFSDINQLLFLCAGDLWEECKDYVLEKAQGVVDIKEQIIVYSVAYAEYFIDNPHVFELMFLQNFTEFIKESPPPPEIALELNKLLYEAAKKKLIAVENADLIENLIGSSIHGLLLFYLKKRTRADKEEILQLIEHQVKYILSIN